MKIRGAVLETIGASRPYAASEPLSVIDLELDDPGAGELLVRIEAAGLCHSDLSVVDGNRVRPTPMLLGHEAAGIVEKAGADSDLTPGQRVVMTFLPRCGECSACATDGLAPCIPGSAANGAGTLLSGAVRLTRPDAQNVLHHLGVSGFATHAVVDRRSVVPVDSDVPAVVASLLGCAVLTGGGAVLNAGQPRPGQTVAIVGMGGVGMAAMLTALAHADVRVIAVDRLPDKLALARDLGAHATYTPEAVTEKAEVVIEAVGHAAALEGALAMTAPGGRTVTVGLPAPDARISLSPLSLVAEGRTLIGSYLGSAVPARDIPRFVELWRDGKLPVEKLVSATLTLDEINRGMDELADGRAVRQIIEL